MFSYNHKVQYYETDKMGIVHHSNYIRWFEEARADTLEKIGIPYDYLEKIGVIAPIVEVNAKYKAMTRFGETVTITSKITKYTGVRLVVEYEVRGSDNTLKCTGSTTNCFIDENGRLRNLKTEFPEVHDIFETNTSF